MSHLWNGYYYSGQDAVQHRVQATIQPHGLELLLDSGAQLTWLFPEIRKADGIGPGDPVRLERGPAPAETLVFPDTRILEVLVRFAPHLTPVPASSFALRLGLLAAGGLAIAIVALYFGTPMLAAAIASTIPTEWEERLGSAAFEQMAPQRKRCGETAQEAAQEIVDRLHDASRSPYTFRVAILREPQINAFAMPGGYIVVHSGLLERTKRPEELAGVLAHEMEHVVQRHSMKAMARELSFRALLTIAIGDLNSAIALAGTLGALHFQRQDEEDADQAGIRRMMAARIDPEGMVDAFKMLEVEGDRAPRVVRYLSTHPMIEDRVERLQRVADEYDGAIDALSQADWRKVASACKP